jgi:carbon-monoxide dehydrogenase large subunit
MGRAGMVTEGATVRILPGGDVQLSVGAVSQGHSVETTLPQVVADHLGVDIDQISVVQADTEKTPYGAGTAGSRTAVNFGSASRMAAEKMRAKVLAIAAHAMESSPDDLEMTDGIIAVKGTPARNMTLADVIDIAYLRPDTLPSDMEGGLEVSARYTAPPFTLSNACHFCLVEVDRVSGRAEVLRYVVSEDCGTMINPMVVDGQIDGGIVQGIGGVLYEHMVYDADGNPLTTTFVDYLLPTTTEVPLIEHDHLQTPAPGNPSGFKGMGEGGVIGAVPAVANAVADALAPLGIVATRMPFGPLQLFDLIQAATRSDASTSRPG